jgi:hypothetical protein
MVAASATAILSDIMFSTSLALTGARIRSNSASPLIFNRVS